MGIEYEIDFVQVTQCSLSLIIHFYCYCHYSAVAGVTATNADADARDAATIECTLTADNECKLIHRQQVTMTSSQTDFLSFHSLAQPCIARISKGKQLELPYIRHQFPSFKRKFIHAFSY